MVIKQVLLALTIGSTVTCSFAQEITAKKEVPADIRQHVGESYEILYVTKGNLNQDAYSDYAVVLNKKNEKETSDAIEHPEKRPLLLFTGTQQNRYTLAERNDNVVYCVDCGGQMGDPFTGITIKNGYFSVEHYGGSSWRWTRIITFKYNLATRTWHLHKDGGEQYHASEPDKVKTAVKSEKNFGRVPFQQFNIYKEEDN